MTMKGDISFYIYDENNDKLENINHTFLKLYIPFLFGFIF